eukprot:s3235_g4.t1
MALDKATKRRQPMCASCQGKKKPPPPADGFFAKLFGISSPPEAQAEDSDSDYQENQVDEQTGLVGAHSYSILAAVEAPANGGTSWFRNERWIRLRNPWGTGRWKGPGQKPGLLPFSGAMVNCGLQKERLQPKPAEDQKQEGPRGLVLEEDAGTFWMRFADFCEEFATVQVSEYCAGYVSSLCPMKPDSSQARGLMACTLELPGNQTGPVEVVISVIQESDEAFSRQKRKKFSAARLELFEFTSPGAEASTPSRSTGTRGARHVASSGFAVQRETLLRGQMKPGVGYMAVVHWLQATPPQSWNRQCTLRVYAPQRLQLDPLRDLAAISTSQREAYEAAAMGPRGACLKEQGGVQLRCWSDRDSGTIVLVFDATAAQAGLFASIHWRLQNAHLQPNFPATESINAKGVQEHIQHVELKPGQRQLTLVSWLDPVLAFSASYSWQAATDPCAECGAPVGTQVPGRFSGAYRKVERQAVHEECYLKHVMRTASRCLSCSEPVARMNGYGGQFFEFTAGQLGDHAAGRVHLECHEAFQRRFAASCLHCRKPILKMDGFSGRHFHCQDGHFGSHGSGAVHEECNEAFLRQWVPKCLHCKEPLLKSGRFSGRIFDYGGAGAKSKQAVHEECHADFQRAKGARILTSCRSRRPIKQELFTTAQIYGSLPLSGKDASIAFARQNCCTI